MKSWTKEEEAILRERYIKCDNIKDLYPMLPGRGYNAIKGHANVMGLVRVIYSDFNKDFFEEPNLLNCLIAGELATDGCVISPKNRAKTMIHFGKCAKDKDYLYKIKDALSFTGNILSQTRTLNLKTSRNNNLDEKSYTFFFFTLRGCDKTARDLHSVWNITPRKTLTLGAPNLTEFDHIIAYYVGCVFGDGGFSFKKDGKLNFDTYLLGTKNLLSFFKKSLDILCPFHTSAGVIPEREGAKIFQYKIGIAKSYIILKIFKSFDLDAFCMERKFNILNDFILEIETSALTPKQIDGIKKNISPQAINLLAKYGQKFPDKFLL